MSRKEMHIIDIRIVGFDLDGTLWDACAPVREAWRRELAGLGREERTPTLAQFQSVMGLPPRPLALRLFPGMEEGEALALARRCTRAENDYLRRHGAAPYPGLEPALARLGQGRRLFLVSNCDAGYIEAFLDHYRLGGYFAAHACAANGRSKGENIAAVMAALGWRTLCMWATPRATATRPRPAGAAFVHAAWGFGTADRALAAAPSLAALPGVIEGLERER